MADALSTPVPTPQTIEERIAACRNADDFKAIGPEVVALKSLPVTQLFYETREQVLGVAPPENTRTKAKRTPPAPPPRVVEVPATTTVPTAPAPATPAPQTATQAATTVPKLGGVPF